MRTPTPTDALNETISYYSFIEQNVITVFVYLTLAGREFQRVGPALTSLTNLQVAI